MPSFECNRGNYLNDNGRGGPKVIYSLSTHPSVTPWSRSTINHLQQPRYSNGRCSAETRIYSCSGSGDRWQERWTDNCSTNKASCCWSPFLHPREREVVASAASREKIRLNQHQVLALAWTTAILRLLLTLQTKDGLRLPSIGQSRNSLAGNYNRWLNNNLHSVNLSVHMLIAQLSSTFLDFIIWTKGAAVHSPGFWFSVSCRTLYIHAEFFADWVNRHAVSLLQCEMGQQVEVGLPQADTLGRYALQPFTIAYEFGTPWKKSCGRLYDLNPSKANLVVCMQPPKTPLQYLCSKTSSADSLDDSQQVRLFRWW